MSQQTSNFDRGLETPRGRSSSVRCRTTEQPEQPKQHHTVQQKRKKKKGSNGGYGCGRILILIVFLLVIIVLGGFYVPSRWPRSTSQESRLFVNEQGNRYMIEVNNFGGKIKLFAASVDATMAQNFLILSLENQSNWIGERSKADVSLITSDSGQVILTISSDGYSPGWWNFYPRTIKIGIKYDGRRFVAHMLTESF